MPIKPLHNYVLVKKVESKDISPGGIVLPTSLSNSTEAEVVEIGPEVDENTCPIEKGCKVVYEKHTGTEISQDGDKYLLLRAFNILAVLGE